MFFLRTMLAALLLVLIPSACATLDAQNDRRQQNLQRPNAERFAIGDTFTYSNPTTTWQIIDIRGNRLIWQSSLSERMITSPNPFLPALRWESARYGQGQRIIGRQKGKLFPLRTGKTTRFTAQTTNARGQRQNFTWNCVVGDRQETIVPAGTFQTFEVLCQRKNANALIYRYAPAIARIVEFRTPEFGLARATRRQLLGYNSRDGGASVTIGDSPFELGGAATTSPFGIGEKKTQPYRPTLPPISPLPFAPPADFFAPQQDSAPSSDAAQGQPDTQPLKRLLQEALKEQQNRVPILPQFQENAPKTTTPPTQPEQPPQSQETPKQETPTQETPTQETPTQETPTQDESSQQPAPANITSAVLLGEYPSLSQARQAWQRISQNRKLTKSFAGRRYDILRRNDRGRGILYDLYAHPYINAETAREVCEEVRKQFRRNTCRITAWTR